MTTIKMKFNLQEIRLSRGLSQTDLAKLCGLTVITIQNYERGKKKQYTHDVIEKFCEALNCVPGDLFVLEQAV